MKLKDFLTLKVGAGVLVSGTRYSPYINYSWSQPLTVGGNQQIKDTGTVGLNLQQFFGQGAWFNGIDQNIVIETEVPVVTSPVWTICFNVDTASNNKYIVRSIGGVLKIVWFNSGLTYYNGSVNIKLDTTNSNRSGSYVVKSDGSNIYTYLNNVLISTISQTVAQLSLGLIRDLAGYNGTSLYLGILKDVYLFKKALSQIEIENYNNNPNQFFMDSLEDSSCVLAMPMCEKNNLVRNYKNNTDYPIANYLTTCRTNAQRLPYGLQTSGFKKGSNGVILSKSNFLEADGVGYGNTRWIADTTNDFSIECVFNRHLNTADNIFGLGLGLSSDFRFRADSSKFTFSFGSPTKYIESPASIGSHLVTINYKADTKTYSLFINGVLIGSQSGSEIINTTISVGLLSNSRGTIVPSSTGTSARLFKVHKKALTQEEITKNFNKYQAQGLLNE